MRDEGPGSGADYLMIGENGWRARRGTESVRRGFSVAFRIGPVIRLVLAD